MAIYTSSAPLRSWQVKGSGSNIYTVEERADSKNGGTYLHCTCQGWLIAYRNGHPCKHIASLQPQPLLAKPYSKAWNVLSTDARLPHEQPPLVPLNDPHANGACGLPQWQVHTKEDHDAYVALMGDVRGGFLG